MEWSLCDPDGRSRERMVRQPADQEGLEYIDVHVIARRER